MFQSAKRILTPSNNASRYASPLPFEVSIRQADPHAFERGDWIMRRELYGEVSIRQADPHAFELVWHVAFTVVREEFQSAKRILTPSNSYRSRLPVQPTISFNPPSGSSRLRTRCRKQRCLQTARRFNPPSGSSRLRTMSFARRANGP